MDEAKKGASVAEAQQLIQAIEARDEERVRSLVAAEPELAHARDASGVSAPLAALYRGHEGIAASLAAAKGELDVFEAAALGRVERLRELLDGDPDGARAWTEDGFTALHYAAFFDGPEAVRLLIEHGADVNAVSRHEQIVVAPLNSVSASGDEAHGARDDLLGQLEAVRLLLDAGADPNAVQPGGFTPLHAAAQEGRRELAELLLERGADPAATTDEGKTAADFAREAGHEALADLLAQGG